MRVGLHRWRPGLIASLLALAAQITFSIASPAIVAQLPPERQLSVLLAGPNAICHGSNGDRQAPRHHAVDCALCPYCAMITGTALLRGSGSAVLAPHVALLAVEIDIVLNVVPPHLPLVTARPRGPPIPV